MSEKGEELRIVCHSIDEAKAELAKLNLTYNDAKTYKYGGEDVALFKDDKGETIAHFNLYKDILVICGIEK